MQIYDVTQPIVLKKGVYQLNDDPNFNYQLNRVINWDGGRPEDVEKISHNIHTSADWKRELIALGATRDHFINYHLIGHEIDLLTNVKSLTFRLFTDKEGAENHCNVGNGKLALDTIDCWLTGLRRRDED